MYFQYTRGEDPTAAHQSENVDSRHPCPSCPARSQRATPPGAGFVLVFTHTRRDSYLALYIRDMTATPPGAGLAQTRGMRYQRPRHTHHPRRLCLCDQRYESRLSYRRYASRVLYRRYRGMICMRDMTHTYIRDVT